MKGMGLHLREERNSWLLELGFSRFMTSSVWVRRRPGWSAAAVPERVCAEFRAVGPCGKGAPLLRKRHVRFRLWRLMQRRISRVSFQCSDQSSGRERRERPGGAELPRAARALLLPPVCESRSLRYATCATFGDDAE